MKMKKVLMFVCAMVFALGISATANGTLIDNSDGTIYDVDLGMLWLKDANYIFTSGWAADHTTWGDGQTTWAEATAWIDYLNASQYLGHNTWRLPSGLNQDGSGPSGVHGNGSPSGDGYDGSDSEMGRLYYLEGITLESQAPFTNISVIHPYWTSTEYPPDPSRVAIFGFSNGVQHIDTGKGYDNAYALPVCKIVTTATVSSITVNSVTSGGVVSSNGSHTATVRGVCWSTSAYPTTSNSKTTNGSGIGSFTSSITGLSPSTTYHVRAYATYSAGAAYGSDVTFTTSAAAPTVTTGSATSVTATSGTLNGTVNPNSASTTVTFEYGTDTIYGSTVTAAQSPVTGTSNQAVSAIITGLTSGIAFHFRVKATNSGGTNYGEDQVFTTSSAPTVTTNSAASVTSDTASLNGTVNPNGLATTYYFEYGTTTNYGLTTGLKSAGSEWSAISVNSFVSGISPSTTYHFRLTATNSLGTTYGNDQSFTTSTATPIATTNSATSVTANSATLNGAVNPNGASTTTIFEYGTTTGYGSTVTATQSPLTGSSSQSVSANLTSLTQGVAYHFRVKATNSAGTVYGNDQTFTTPTTGPTVTTGSATSVTSNSATLNGTVNPNGTETTYYFQYGTTTSYGSTTTSTSAGAGTSDVSVNASLTGLSTGTTYHFRLAATNSAGTVYGSDVTFATISEQGSPVTISSVSGARGKKVVIPIILSNIEGSEIASLSVDVGYDTTYFEKPRGAIGPAGSASEKTIGTSEPSSGIFRMTILSVSNNNVIGDGVIAYLTLTILSNAPGSSSILTSTPSASDPSGSDVAVKGESGTITILGNMAGDCNGDGNVSISEVQSAINMYLGINAVEECVDVNGNGKVSIGELQKVINNHLNINAAGALEYTESGGQAHVNATAIAPSLDVGQVSGSLGETVTIPVTLTNASGYQVSGVSTDITYDTSYLESPSVSIGAAGTSAGKDVSFNEISSGTIRVGVFSASNNNAIGDGIVAYVSFKIKSSASSGQTTLGNTPSGSDPSGNDITMDGADGVVTVSYSSTSYVNSDGICEGNDPCYTTIQAAINEASTGEAIMISGEIYDENITLDADKTLTLIGSSTGTTTLRKAPKAPKGSLTLQKMTILP